MVAASSLRGWMAFSAREWELDKALAVNVKGLNEAGVGAGVPRECTARACQAVWTQPGRARLCGPTVDPALLEAAPCFPSIWSSSSLSFRDGEQTAKSSSLALPRQPQAGLEIE